MLAGNIIEHLLFFPLQLPVVTLSLAFKKLVHSLPGLPRRHQLFPFPVNDHLGGRHDVFAFFLKFLHVVTVLMQLCEVNSGAPAAVRSRLSAQAARHSRFVSSNLSVANCRAATALEKSSSAVCSCR